MATIIDGNGIVTAEGTSTTQGRLRLGEDTDNGTNYVELQAPASVASNVTFTLPSADGTDGQVLQTNGSGTLSFASAGSSVTRSTKTTTYTLAAADKGNLIEATSGTFNFNVTAAATLGNGWWCYVSNAGSGFITIDPNASETVTVNGVALTTWVLWPNEMGILVCNGSNFFYYVFQKGEITQTVSSAVASVSFATGLAYRSRMSLSVANAGYASSGNAVQLQINNLLPGSSSLTGGYMRNLGSSTYGGASATSMTLTAGFSPTATPSANNALFANIQINSGSAGVFASGNARYINDSGSPVALTTMGAWDDLTLTSISTISIFQTSVNTVSGTFTLREL